MATKRAKTMDEDDIQAALRAADASRQSSRDRLMILLTHRLGLRAKEVAYMHVEDFLDAKGRVCGKLHVTQRAAKYGKEREIDFSKRLDLTDALNAYLEETKRRKGRVFWDRSGAPMTPNAVQKQLARIYLNAGLIGCSSHSGRRSLANKYLRKMHLVGATIKDLQRVLGHSQLSSTEAYIDHSVRSSDLLGML